VSTHLEIAKERFLDMMATDRGSAIEHIAEHAINQADAFMAEYAKHQSAPFATAMERTTKGCPKCFGSGGKISRPCKNCNGSGKVEVQA
jgi:hypothetical protein